MPKHNPTPKRSITIRLANELTSEVKAMLPEGQTFTGAVEEALRAWLDARAVAKAKPLPKPRVPPKACAWMAAQPMLQLPGVI